jgi:hypothetical protein
MKHVISSVVIAAALVLAVGGCAQLTEAQKARIEQLTVKNETLTSKLAGLYTAARQGLADPAEIVAAIQEVTATIAANHEEIKKIQEEGETQSWIAGAVGLFGRSAIHLITKIPLPGAWGMILSAGLTALLGGSSTAKKVSAPVPATKEA